MDTNEPLKHPVVYRKKIGRPFGGTNYGGGASFVAQQFKREGYDWRHEIVAAYAQFKCAQDAYLAGTGSKPEPNLLEFWTRMMPYITQTVAEKDAHKRQRNVNKAKRYTVTDSALERLAEAEGRQI